MAIFSADVIVNIEDYFKEFKIHVQGSVTAKQALKTDSTDMDTGFPGTATVESDFSL